MVAYLWIERAVSAGLLMTDEFLMFPLPFGRTILSLEIVDSFSESHCAVAPLLLSSLPMARSAKHVSSIEIATEEFSDDFRLQISAFEEL